MSCGVPASSSWLASAYCALQLYGLVWSGPSLHYWQQLQERIFKGKRDTGSLVKRVHLSTSTYVICSRRSWSCHGGSRPDFQGSEVLLLQVLLDQLTFGPFCNALFMSYIAMVVEGEDSSLASSTERRRRSLVYRACNDTQGSVWLPCPATLLQSSVLCRSYWCCMPGST